MNDKRDLPTTKTGGKEVRQKVSGPKEKIDSKGGSDEDTKQFTAPGREVRK